jgi:TolA-binding protein
MRLTKALNKRKVSLNSVNKKLAYLEERQRDLIDEIREMMGCNEAQGKMDGFDEDAIKEEEEAFEETNRLEGGYQEEDDQGDRFGPADEITDRSSAEKETGNFRKLLQGEMGNARKKRGQPFFKVSGVDEMIGKFLDERSLKQLVGGV